MGNENWAFFKTIPEKWKKEKWKILFCREELAVFSEAGAIFVKISRMPKHLFNQMLIW